VSNSRRQTCHFTDMECQKVFSPCRPTEHGQQSVTHRPSLIIHHSCSLVLMLSKLQKFVDFVHIYFYTSARDKQATW